MLVALNQSDMNDVKHAQRVEEADWQPAFKYPKLSDGADRRSNVEDSNVLIEHSRAAEKDETSLSMIEKSLRDSGVHDPYR